MNFKGKKEKKNGMSEDKVKKKKDEKEGKRKPDGNSVIRLDGIIKRFFIGQPNELEILHGINLEVKKGEFLSIVGESGSGKSTLMNIIGALDRPTEGSYFLDDTDICKAKDKKLSEIRKVNKFMDQAKAKPRNRKTEEKSDSDLKEKELAEEIFQKFKDGKKLTTEEFLLLQKYNIM